MRNLYTNSVYLSNNNPIQTNINKDIYNYILTFQLSKPSSN